MTTPTLASELDKARNLIDNLHVALKSSRLIGTAIGIVMERHKLTPDQAFTVLVTLSQETNRKLRDVADGIVFTGDIPAN